MISSVPSKNLKTIFTTRQEKLSSAMQTAGLSSVVINPGATLVYLTGLHFHLMERPVVAFFSPNQPVTLVIPELEVVKTAELPFPSHVFLYGEDPNNWGDLFRQAAQAAELEGNIGVEPNRLRFLELQLIQAAAPDAKFLSAEDTISNLRLYKDMSELSWMRKAVDIAQRALQSTLPIIRPGLTEREIAAELTLQLLRAGSDSEIPFSPIVSGGPNSANPHATPTDRPLQIGDLLLFDWGAYFQGYCSDLTRTFAIGDVSPEMKKIAAIVKEANEAGRAAAQPGVPAENVDKAARDVIETAGYGEYFHHRTGHGLGMEGHEAPYIRTGNMQILETGMTFTVEPGIYLQGRNGVRIEDNVVITESGSETLSSLPRELIVL